MKKEFQDKTNEIFENLAEEYETVIIGIHQEDGKGCVAVKGNLPEIASTLEELLTQLLENSDDTLDLIMTKTIVDVALKRAYDKACKKFRKASETEKSIEDFIKMISEKLDDDD